MKNPTCFVIIGYGKKTSYANGKIRELNLQETYDYLIKPVFENLGIPCYRAIDKNLAGSIDKLMLQEIKEADIALVDLSTLNANVMWELGVRHALKPHHTIMICEKEQMEDIPFDIRDYVIHEYTHSEVGIPYSVVDSFVKKMTKVVSDILEQNPPKIDSPVYDFLESQTENEYEIKGDEDRPGNDFPDYDASDSSEEYRGHDNIPSPAENHGSFVDLMDNAQKAIDKKDYQTALKSLEIAEEHARKNMALKENLPLILTKKASCIYSSNPDNENDLKEARNQLAELHPEHSIESEVLTLGGAINKQLYNLTEEEDYLNDALHFYEKGFQLRENHQDGINAAAMLYKKAVLNKKKNEDWEDVKLKADVVRNTVIEMALDRSKHSDFSVNDEKVDMLLTIAEAYQYRGDKLNVEKFENMAIEKQVDDEVWHSYQSQKTIAKDIEEHLNR